MPKTYRNQLYGLTATSVTVEFTTSAEEVMHLSDSVCLSLCKISKKSYERILMKFCGEMERGGKETVNYGGGQNSFVDPGSFSRILYR